ncbi:MAG TPA: DUF2807 domain-containing protein [Sphingomicrobium sp.]|nr:DUF2807 domain-containing protein [Sphingomicrobium sp.]
MRSFLPLFGFAFAAATPVLATEVVPTAPFKAVQLRGGGSVVVVPGPAPRVTLVEGSTAYTRFRVAEDGQLKIDTCYDRCPRQYRMRVEIQSPTVPGLAVSGGGLINVRPGFAAQERLSAAVNGGGKIDAQAVHAGSVSAAVNGGGDVLVHAQSHLSAAVNGGGMVRYLGNPRVSSAVRGGGLVRAAR